MTNCAIIVQTTIEVNTFWNKHASSITITTDENKENEFAWFLTTEKQMQRGLSNTLKLSLMDEGHEQPDSPEVSSWKT